MKTKSFIFIFSLFLFISCSQESTVIRELSTKVIYEYKDKESLPEQRLSVFVASSTDVRKFDSIYIKDSLSDFTWETDDLLRFNANEKNYAGYPSFKVPQGDIFNTGEYNLIIKTKSKEELNYSFFLNYNKDFIELKADVAKEQMKSNGATESIIIYDETNKIIYYGNRADDLKTNRDIWLKYNNAVRYNSIWIQENKSVMCIMPSEKVTPGETNE